jgi:hypothetical protein
MIFQLDYATVITFVLVSYVGVSLILFIAGTYIMQMYAKSKKWDESFEIPLKINGIWFIISLAIGIPLSFLYGDSVLIDFIRFGVNMLVGVFFAIRYYKKENSEAIQFTLIIQAILFIIAVIFSNIFSMLALIVLYG